MDENTITRPAPSGPCEDAPLPGGCCACLDCDLFRLWADGADPGHDHRTAHAARYFRVRLPGGGWRPVRAADTGWVLPDR